MMACFFGVARLVDAEVVDADKFGARLEQELCGVGGEVNEFGVKWPLWIIFEFSRVVGFKEDSFR